ncbi:MAG: DUF705 domain-containing protein [Pseudomonadota bacterium]
MRLEPRYHPAATNPPDHVWVFDVDGTLIGSIRSDRLRPGVTELVRLLDAGGASMVAWSAGGADYAGRMLARFDIAERFCACYEKGARGADGRYLVDHMDERHRPGTLVDDYPEDVPQMGRVIPVRQFLGGNPNDDGLAAALEIARSLCAAR